MTTEYQQLGTGYVLPVSQTLSRSANIQALSMPFRIESDGSVAVVEGRANIIRQEILTVLMTYLGERLMLPFYGSNIAAVVWEPQDSAVINMYLTELHTLVEENFPGVQVNDLSHDQGAAEEGELHIKLDYAYDDQFGSITVNVTAMFQEGPP